ncbi:MAG: hypothetical protein WC958_02005 [Dehalococcoidales bacterium]
MGKYNTLSEYLVKQNLTSLSFDFQQIEQIIGSTLPSSAYIHRAWWANTLSHPQAKSWLNVGWKVRNVDFKTRMVNFLRPLILYVFKASGNKDTTSLILTTDEDGIVFILNGATASATTKYSWRQITQTLIDVNPNIFGEISYQPDHHIFPEMLAELGYSTVNWETGESWIP